MNRLEVLRIVRNVLATVGHRGSYGTSAAISAPIESCNTFGMIQEWADRLEAACGSTPDRSPLPTFPVDCCEDYEAETAKAEALMAAWCLVQHNAGSRVAEGTSKPHDHACSEDYEAETSEAEQLMGAWCFVQKLAQRLEAAGGTTPADRSPLPAAPVDCCEDYEAETAQAEELMGHWALLQKYEKYGGSLPGAQEAAQAERLVGSLCGLQASASTPPNRSPLTATETAHAEELMGKWNLLEAYREETESIAAGQFSEGTGKYGPPSGPIAGQQVAKPAALHKCSERGQAKQLMGIWCWVQSLAKRFEAAGGATPGDSRLVPTVPVDCSRDYEAETAEEQLRAWCERERRLQRATARGNRWQNPHHRNATDPLDVHNIEAIYGTLQGVVREVKKQHMNM
jgi:hypothetical protein|uniref:Uncharacterized protein n=2 Tax=Eutreptiella gymnastica TaxID=73025 RepID=A0A7S4CU83_9EUGL